MFQYAIASVIAKKNNSEVFLDLSFFENQEKYPGFTPRQFGLDIFDVEYKLIDKKDIQTLFFDTPINPFCKLFSFPKKKVYKEIAFDFNSNLLLFKPPLYLEGYFQTEKYFKEMESMILDKFKFPENIGTTNDQYQKLIIQDDSVSVHFRRGDYVNDVIAANFHGSCSIEYYKKAFQNITAKVKNPHFFIFSDDISWVEKHIKNWHHKITFVKQNKEEKSWIDMLLMSRCKHNIIANSSFSWWGAWLNNNTDKIIISPNIWFNDSTIDTSDIVPKSWIRI